MNKAICKNCVYSDELLTRGKYLCVCLDSEFFQHFMDPDDHCPHVRIVEITAGQMTEKELNI